MDITYKPVNTHDAEGNRFVLTFDETDNSVTVFDNHKRDGYVLYAGDNKQFTGGEKLSKTHMTYLIQKMNELYNENQALKEGSKYHQIVIKKIDELIEEFEFYSVQSYGRYLDSEDEKDKLVYQSYMDVSLSLQYIRSIIQGDEYE